MKHIFILSISILFYFSAFSQSVNALISKGIEAGNKRNYKEAILQFDNVLKQEPNNAQALYYKAYSLQNLGAYSEAIKFYTLSLKYAQRGETYHNRGYCYIKTSQNDLAIKDLSKAMELDGSNLRILKTRIIAYKKMEKYDLMLKDINTYLEKDETNFNMRANKAIVLSLLEKPKEAIPIYNELIKEKPNEKKLYYGIGQLYLETNQLNYALYNADKAIMLDGKYAKAYLLKSEILMAVNKKEESCRMFNKSIELGIDSNREEYKMLKKYCNE